MLLNKVDLLESQTRQYRKLIRNYEQNDSLNSELVETNKIYYLCKIASLEEHFKAEVKKRKIYQFGTFGSIGIALLALIFLK